MTALAIREKLVSYMQVADDRKLKAIYILLENDIKEERISLEQYNIELDEAEAEFERGEFISNEEMIAMVKTL